MKIALLLTWLFAIAFASTVRVHLSKQHRLKQSTQEVLQLQTNILRLFRYINQPNHYTEQRNIAEHYDIEDNIDNYDDKQSVREFMDLNRLGFLPKDEIFSIFNEKHKQEVLALFKILYYAKDYETLYKTACWARIFMNEGLFVHTLSVALVQRPDTTMIYLPPIYEIYPNYFYNNEIIQKAQQLRRMEKDLPTRTLEEQMDHRETMQELPRQGIRQTLVKDERMNERYQDQLRKQETVLPVWHTLLPEYLRGQRTWFDQREPQPVAMGDWTRQLRLEEQMRQDQLKQERMRQDQLNRERMRQDQLNGERMRRDQLRQEQISREELGLNRQDYQRDNFEGITVDATDFQKVSDSSTEDVVMSYFTEDVGLNAYYYYYNIYFPFWLPNECINLQTDRRGEQFYYMIQQLLARYHLERISNGLGDIRVLDYLIPIQTGYRPSLAYTNGLKFPERPNNLWITMQRALENVHLDNNYTNSYMFVRDYERRIRDAIDLGYVTTSMGKQIDLFEPRGFETLGNMIEGNMESPNSRFYGCLQIFARLLLGNTKLSKTDYQIAPSVLEHFETSLRDPIFYQFNKRMLMYFQRYMRSVQPYTTKDLMMPGVKIENVQVGSLVTYFDYHYADISNAVYDGKVETDLRHVPIRVKQMRLNNKHFKYALDVMSDKQCDALVKVFLGPRYDELDRRVEFVENRLNFVELDKFQVELTPGVNRIERNSRDSYYSDDRTSYRELYMRVMMDINRSELPVYQPREPEWGMPKRLLLPKGTRNGKTYQMYFIITPYRAMKDQVFRTTTDMPVLDWRRVMDDKPLGYPLDRPIDETVFYVPNSHFKDVIIYHKDLKDLKVEL